MRSLTQNKLRGHYWEIYNFFFFFSFKCETLLASYGGLFAQWVCMAGVKVHNFVKDCAILIPNFVHTLHLFVFGKPFSYLPHLLTHQPPPVVCDGSESTPCRRHQSVPPLGGTDPSGLQKSEGLCLPLGLHYHTRAWSDRHPVTPPPVQMAAGGPVQFGFRGSTVWPSLRPSGIC